MAVDYMMAKVDMYLISVSSVLVVGSWRALAERDNTSWDAVAWVLRSACMPNEDRNEEVIR